MTAYDLSKSGMARAIKMRKLEKEFDEKFGGTAPREIRPYDLGALHRAREEYNAQKELYVRMKLKK